MNKSKKLVNIRKLEYLGHIVQNKPRHKLLQTILQGKIAEKRSVERKHILWLKAFESGTPRSSPESS